MSQKPPTPTRKSFEEQRGIAPVQGGPASAAPGWIWLCESTALVIATVASLMLVLEHFGAMDLPGCGRGSACAQAAASVYGTVPGIGVPTSFVGLAYFVAALVGWVAGKGVMSNMARWVARLSALVSLSLVVVVFVEKMPCVYCLAVHAANLIFVGLEEVRTPGSGLGRARVQVGAALATFVVGMSVLGMGDMRARERAKEKAERELAASTAKMIDATIHEAPVETKPTPVETKPLPDKVPVVADTTPGKVLVEPDVPKTAPATDLQPPTPPVPKPPVTTQAQAGFSGRHRFGPEKAAVRIVMFTDYQCPDCFKIEGELKQLMETTPNLSVIIKNFPMCSDCNVKAPNLDGNACWAARAAITAGMIRGDDGFWQMHEWLFSQHGSFTDQSLPQALANMGYDPSMFTTLMQTEQPLQEIKKDVDEGYGLGIFYTPMIFINGVELKGWNAPQALTRAVQAVIAANPKLAAPSEDHPPTALEKYMADWRERPVQAIPESITKRALGKANAPVTVVVFGDYQEEGTREVDGLLRLFATGPDYGMKYVFANFPVDQSCNPYVDGTKFAGGCRCSLAAEGADIMAGSDAFWKVHNWIMASKGVFTDKALEAEAQFDGLDPALLKEAMANPAAKAKVVADAAAGKSLGIQSIPMVFINGRYVPRWKLENENLLPRMIREEAGWAGK